MTTKIALGAAALFVALTGVASAQPLGTVTGVGDARLRNEPSVVGLSSTQSPLFRYQPGAYVPAYGNGFGVPSYGPGPFYHDGAPAYAPDDAYGVPARGRVSVYNGGRRSYRPAPRLVERRAYAPRRAQYRDRVRHIRVYRPFS